VTKPFSFAFRILFTLLLTACGESKLQHHPIPDRLPYSGLLPDAIELSPVAACTATPLVFLDTVPVPLSEAVILQTISESRVLLIDKVHHHMTEFDWSRDRTTRIADHGRGPGFILFTSGSTRIGGQVVLALGDSRLSFFDCAVSPCRYLRESITSSPAIGVHGSGGEFHLANDQLFPESDRAPAFVRADADGKRMDVFGETYDVRGLWILNMAMISTKTAGYDQRLLFGYANLPYLYTFPDVSRDRSNPVIYRFGGFLQGRSTYDTETGGVRVVEDDHSMIASISMHGPDIGLAAIETRRNRRIENRLYRWDLTSQLIRFDITSGQSCVMDSCDGCSYQVSENRVIKLEGESWVLYALHD